LDIERTVVYRSEFLKVIYAYIEQEYIVEAYQDMPNGKFLSRIATDIDILELFCTIVEKRMFIIDDKEFVGEKQSLMSSFLPVN